MFWFALIFKKLSQLSISLTCFIINLTKTNSIKHEKIPLRKLQPVECKLAFPKKREILEIFRRTTRPNTSEYSFPKKPPSISEHFYPRKHFSFSLILLKLEVLVCRPITLQEKGRFFKCLKIFETLEHLFISWHFHKGICSKVFSPLEIYRL